MATTDMATAMDTVTGMAMATATTARGLPMLSPRLMLPPPLLLMPSPATATVMATAMADTVMATVMATTMARGLLSPAIMATAMVMAMVMVMATVTATATTDKSGCTVYRCSRVQLLRN